MQIKSRLKILGVGLIKNGCGQSCDRTLKLTLSEEWTSWINWFFACRFTKIKSWSKIYWVGMIKNGCGQCGHSKIDCISKLNRWNNLIFACWYKFRKAESWFNHFFDGLCQKWQFLFSSWDPKTYCILRVNIWIELIILTLIVM